MPALLRFLLVACGCGVTALWSREEIVTDRTAWSAEYLGVPTSTLGAERDSLQALTFSGPAYRGRPTRVYALYGIPALASREHPAPGIVLVHGGAGRVFPEWVHQWVARGYVALALDIGGADAPAGYAGPRGYGGYDQISEPLSDQWAYHAVANIIRAHSLLRTFPEVDPSRTTIYGVSWGAFLTQDVISLDHRFLAAVAIYGCGFRIEDDGLLKRFANKTPEERARWTRNWDPESHLSRATTPMLFVNGTEDRIFRLVPYHQTYRLLSEARRTIKLVVGLKHGQQAATSIPEADRYLDSFTRAAPPLLHLGAVIRDGVSAHAQVRGKARIASAAWWFTESAGPYHVDEGPGVDLATASLFRAVPAQWDAAGRLTVTTTPETKIGFFEITDEFGAKTTSELSFSN